MESYREENAPIIQSGEGFHLIDVEGNVYLDGISALWCNLHGYQVPEIDAALKVQLDCLGHSTLLGQSNVPSIQLARDLVRITPHGLNKVFYSDSGATAVEIALKIAYQYHHQKKQPERNRKLFVTLGGAYHGDTIGSVSLGGMELFHKIYSDLLFQKISIPAPVSFRVPEDHSARSYLQHCYDVAEQTIRTQHQEIAAVVVEPLVQGAAGILVHPDGYLKFLRELTADFGLLLIADEVAVGFGRTGTLFACEQEQCSPDILCLAKGLTGGYLPLAATLTTDQIYEAFLGKPSENRTFFHGHTYTGNPLGCAAALASLELLESRDLISDVQQKSQSMNQWLQDLTVHPHVGEVRQKGMMIGIELVKSKTGMIPFTSQLRVGHQVTLTSRKKGIIIRPLGDVVVLMPALAMPEDLLSELVTKVIASIDEVTKTLERS